MAQTSFQCSFEFEPQDSYVKQRSAVNSASIPRFVASSWRGILDIRVLDCVQDNFYVLHSRDGYGDPVDTICIAIIMLFSRESLNQYYKLLNTIL